MSVTPAWGVTECVTPPPRPVGVTVQGTCPETGAPDWVSCVRCRSGVPTLCASCCVWFRPVPWGPCLRGARGEQPQGCRCEGEVCSPAHAPGVLAVAVSGGPLSLCVGEFRVLVRVSLGLRVTRPGSLPRSHWGICPLGAQLGWTELCWASGL